MHCSSNSLYMMSAWGLTTQTHMHNHATDNRRPAAGAYETWITLSLTTELLQENIHEASV